MSGPRRGAIVSAGILLGTGLGGFVDGILFHQILQWHHMLSSVRAPTTIVAIEYNMIWDGLFHAFTWLMVVLGVIRLWSAGRGREVAWSTPTFVGSIALGWGLFNVVEGIVDHEILGIHHVHPGDGQLAWDLGFLAFGVVAIAIGVGAIRAGRGEARARGGVPLEGLPTGA